MYKLLIVEDEQLLRQGLIHMLPWIEHGFMIIGGVSNGEEAIRYIESSMPDIIITDIVMPIMNGLELTRILKEKYPSIQIIVLSSHDHFDYAREALRLGATDYILKQEIDSESILKTLLNASKNINMSTYSRNVDNKPAQEELQTQLFLSLISNTSSDISSIRNIMQKSKITLEEENLCMIIFKINATAFHISEEVNLNIALLKNVLSPFTITLKNPYIFATADDSMILLFNSSTAEFENIQKLTLKALIEIDNRHNIPLLALISNLFNGMENIGSNYSKTMKISDYLFFEPSKRVISYNYFLNNIITPNLDHNIIHPYIEKLEFLSIFKCTYEALSKLLDEGAFFWVYELKRDLVEFVNFTIFHLYEMELNVDEVKNARFHYIQLIEEANSFTDLMEKFKSIMNSIDNCVKSNHKVRTSENISLAIEYIQNNFSSDISLSSVADYLYINKSYLSELFKEQVGENFSDYLIRIRIEKAKEILKNQRVTISFTGEQVGYPNTSYFIQLFKKIVGMKPSEYIKKFRIV